MSDTALEEVQPTPRRPSKDDRPEIIEKNISYITINWWGMAQELQPYDGEAKWFRDELGYDWVKVRTVAGESEYRTRVIRSDLVVDVAYNPRALS